MLDTEASFGGPSRPSAQERPLGLGRHAGNSEIWLMRINHAILF